MSDDFKKEEVVELAERIYINRIRNNNIVNEEYTKNDAKMAFQEAMIFRTTEKEIFEGKI
jgi:hypothetical protein